MWRRSIASSDECIRFAAADSASIACVIGSRNPWSRGVAPDREESSHVPTLRCPHSKEAPDSLAVAAETLDLWDMRWSTAALAASRSMPCGLTSTL